jgi:hypothetical protein
MQVNITKRIDTPEGKRYSPVIVGPNGRIKPDWVMANDRLEKHPEPASMCSPLRLRNSRSSMVFCACGLGPSTANCGHGGAVRRL